MKLSIKVITKEISNRMARLRSILQNSVCELVTKTFLTKGFAAKLARDFAMHGMGNR